MEHLLWARPLLNFNDAVHYRRSMKVPDLSSSKTALLHFPLLHSWVSLHDFPRVTAVDWQLFSPVYYRPPFNTFFMEIQSCYFLLPIISIKASKYLALTVAWSLPTSSLTIYISKPNSKTHTLPLALFLLH